MTYMKKLVIAAMATMAVAAFAASTASATTLEYNGVTRNETLSITASLTPGTSMVMSRTDGSFIKTCTGSHIAAHTVTPFTASGSNEITATIDTLTFTNCERPVTVHKPGHLEIGHETGTTHATVTSSGAEITTGSPFGTLNCKTGTGVDIGTLTGATTPENPSPHAEIHINAITNCGFLVPSASWKGTYIVTNLTDFGVSA